MRPLTLIDKAFLLKKTALFGSLDLDLLLTIADKMDLLQLKKEAKVFQSGQESHRLYFILEGIVEIRGKNTGILAHLAAGEFFGDEGIFNEKPRLYEAKCCTDASLLTLSRPHLLSIIAECPSVAVSFLEAYTAQLDFRKR